MLFEFFAISVVGLLLAYRWATANYNFFKERGIDYEKPYPFVGNMHKMLLRQQSIFDLIVELYNKGNGKVYGIFEQRTPLLMIRDPELVKQITIKDFDHFMNHRNFLGTIDDNPHDMNNLFGSSLLLMRDARWKDMRSTLSPAFTGSKMRQMFQLMDIAAKEAVDCLKRDHVPESGIELDTKDYCSRFTNDVIASTAFGLQVNSFKDRDNTFYIMGKRMTSFNALQNLKFLFFTTAKRLFKTGHPVQNAGATRLICGWSKVAFVFVRGRETPARSDSKSLLKISLFDKKSVQYFVSLVLDAMKYRQEHNIVRPDMINMLMEARGMFHTDKPKTGTVRDWSDRDIVAQCFVFFLAGFETSASFMCFTAQELMESEDVQQRLYEEVAQLDSDLDGGQLTYEALTGMKYMDQVVSEVLRKWPPTSAIDRECSKDITYVVDGKNIEIKKGDAIWLPTCGFHLDPKYFENPTKFDPDRFSDENKDKIQPFTYFPFGAGQRNCIGSRFALLEAKALIYYLLREFRIAPAKKSCIPLVLSSAGFQLKPKNGFWVKLIPRK